jgi:uncharacterized protein YkwD
MASTRGTRLHEENDGTRRPVRRRVATVATTVAVSGVLLVGGATSASATPRWCQYLPFFGHVFNHGGDRHGRAVNPSDEPAATTPAPSSAAPSPQASSSPEASSVPEETVTVQGAAPTPTASASASETSSLTDEQQVANEVVRLINEQRTSQGLDALTVDDRLTAAATGQAQDMQEHDFLGSGANMHIGSDGSTFDQRIAAAGYPTDGAGGVAENAAYNYSAAGAVSSWMDSEGHRANILNPDLTSTGVGVASDGNGYYFTQDFGSE